MQPGLQRKVAEEPRRPGEGDVRPARPQRALGLEWRPQPLALDVLRAVPEPHLRGSHEQLHPRPGFVRECGPDEVGILLARARTIDTIATTPLRGVFTRGDAWLSTGDLFRRDGDGDYWRLDSARDVIRAAGGPVYSAPIRDALGDLPAVGLAVAYGLEIPGREHELVIAAVTLRAGHSLDAPSLGDALQRLPAPARPDVVHVVDEIPVTTWYRPLTGPLRDAGIPPADDASASASASAERAWYRDRGGRRYRPLTESARRRLSAAEETES